MKRMSLIKLMYAILFTVTPMLGYAGTNDDITNACYLTKKCGARTSLKTLIAIEGAKAGALAGFLTPIPGGMIMGGYAGYIIGSNLGGKISLAYSANEYLYFDDGKCLECDTYQIGEHYECPNGTIVSNGSQVLKCHTTFGGDYWSEETLPPCIDSPIQNKNITNTVAEIHATVQKPTVAGVNVYSGDACLYITCANNGTYDQVKGKCVSQSDSTNIQPAPTPGRPVNPNPNPTQNCINSRTSAEGKACCLVPSSVAKWDGQHCICTDSNKTFINGSCVSQQQSTTVTFTCTNADMVQLYAWLGQYASNAQIVALINQILEFCTNDDNRSQIEFNKMMAELRALIAQTQANIAQAECNLIPGANWTGGKCVCVAAGKVLNEAGTACVDSAETVAANLNASLQRSRNEISGASSKINAIKESFKKTVWKDEDGKFNTTRLASDSIAAVVLGTAGGLITSNVIKKNQVKNGFEDINCTVGGQKVAAWGDEFRVGIQ